MQSVLSAFHCTRTARDRSWWRASTYAAIRIRTPGSCSMLLYFFGTFRDVTRCIWSRSNCPNKERFCLGNYNDSPSILQLFPQLCRAMPTKVQSRVRIPRIVWVIERPSNTKRKRTILCRFGPSLTSSLLPAVNVLFDKCYGVWGIIIRFILESFKPNVFFVTLRCSKRFNQHYSALQGGCHFLLTFVQFDILYNERWCLSSTQSAIVRSCYETRRTRFLVGTESCPPFHHRCGGASYNK